MIQFNLLPDIKIQYLRARRQNHTVVTISSIVIIASLATMAVLAVVIWGVQRTHINNLTDDIQTASDQIEQTEDLSKILTVQNQLNVLTDLHNDKPVASRLFNYLNQATPNDANIANMQADFTANTLTISGNADSLETVNKFVDTLKFTNFTTANNSEESRAFSNVVMSNFGRDATAATYTITLEFDPIIFSEEESVELVVPKIVTTRSEVDQPQALFEDGEN